MILETTFIDKDAVPPSIPTYYYGPATLNTKLADKHITVSQTGMIVMKMFIPNNTIQADFKVTNHRYDMITKKVTIKFFNDKNEPIVDTHCVNRYNKYHDVP